MSCHLYFECISVCRKKLSASLRDRRVECGLSKKRPTVAVLAIHTGRKAHLPYLTVPCQDEPGALLVGLKEAPAQLLLVEDKRIDTNLEGKEPNYRAIFFFNIDSTTDCCTTTVELWTSRAVRELVL